MNITHVVVSSGSITSHNFITTFQIQQMTYTEINIHSRVICERELTAFFKFNIDTCGMPILPRDNSCKAIELSDKNNLYKYEANLNILN